MAYVLIRNANCCANIYLEKMYVYEKKQFTKLNN